MEIHAKLKEKYNTQRNKDVGKGKGKKLGPGYSGSRNKL